jgi:L-cysteine desulfidase
MPGCGMHKFSCKNENLSAHVPIVADTTACVQHEEKAQSALILQNLITIWASTKWSYAKLASLKCSAAGGDQCVIAIFGCSERVKEVVF